MQQNMGLSDNLQFEPHVPPFPKSFPCNHTIFLPLKPTTFSPTCSIHSIQSRGVHVELLTPPASSGEIHVIVGHMFDGKTTTLLRIIESESSNGRFVNLHQFYFLCVLYTCLKFMWVVYKILARFGGWWFFLARFMWSLLFVSTVKHEIIQVQCRIGQFNYLYRNVPFLNLCIVIDLALAFT